MSEEKKKFRWKDRRKATETAIQIKHEQGISAKEAVDLVLKEYEGVFHENADLITEKRYQNFIERVEKEKKYKSPPPKNTKIDYEFTQDKIKALYESEELTGLQATVLDVVFAALAPYSIGFSDVTVNDVAAKLDIKTSSVKGALGHLIRKNYLFTKEVETNQGNITVIDIPEDKLDLYNENIKLFKEKLEQEKREYESNLDMEEEEENEEVV